MCSIQNPRGAGPRDHRHVEAARIQQPFGERVPEQPLNRARIARLRTQSVGSPRVRKIVGEASQRRRERPSIDNGIGEALHRLSEIG